MRKIIITEEQYSKVKSTLIERAINETLTENNGQQGQVDPKTLGIDTKNGTLTIPRDFTAENAQSSTRAELKLFKGAVFKVGRNFASNGILVSNTTIQKVKTTTGGSVESPRKSEVHYYCKTRKFNIPGTPDTYYIEKGDGFNGVQNSLNELCKLAKNPQASTQGTAGQTTYNSKNPNQLVGKKDQTKKLTIPANTAFSFNEGKNGVGFKVNFQNGWFDCKTATFIVNSVSYTSKFLGETLSKNLCKTSVSPKTSASSGGGGGSRPGSSSGGGSTQTAATSNPVIADFQNYI
jgi:hypothetical protein